MQIDRVVGSINRLSAATTFNGKRLLDGSFATTKSAVRDMTNTNPAMFAGIDLGASVAGSLQIDVTSEATNSTGELDFSRSVLPQRVRFWYPSEGAATEVTSDLTWGPLDGPIETTVMPQLQAALTPLDITIEQVSATRLRFVANDRSRGAFGAEVRPGISWNPLAPNPATTVVYGAPSSAASGSAPLPGQATVEDNSGNVTTVSTETLTISVPVGGDTVNLVLSDAGKAAGTSGLVAWKQNEVLEGDPLSFALDADVAKRTTLSIDRIDATTLGTLGGRKLNDLGDLLSDSDYDTAAATVDAAIRDVAKLRGQLGATLRYTVGAARRSNVTANEQATATLSSIVDLDYSQAANDRARETILAAAAQRVMQVTLDRPRQALSLLA